VKTIVAAVLATLAFANVAHAQDAANVEAAKAKYKEGVVLYNVKEYADAIAKFKEAYKLNADPAYLYNIAQAYRLAGDCENAVSFYKTFLRDAPEGTPNVEKARKFLVELETCRTAAATTTVVEEPPPPPEETSTSTSTPTPTSTTTTTTTTTPTTTPAAERAIGAEARVGREDGSPAMRLAGLVSAGAGVLAAGTGVYFGLKARGAHDDLVADLAANGGIWNDALEGREQDAQRDETVGMALTIGGAAAAVAGGVLYYLGRDRGSVESPVTVTPTRGGATIAWACDF
jgi:tetratricopeptide (TPR) repeat protein